MPELARVAHTPRFNDIMQKTFSALVVGAMGVFVLFVAFAEELTVLVGGDAFEGTAPVLQILMLAVAFAYVGSMFGDAFFVHDRLKVSITVSVLVLPANIGLNLLLIPMWEARGAAVAWVASEVLIVASYAFMYRRIIGSLPRVSRGAQILAATCATAIVALVKLLPFASDASPLLVLLAGGSLCAVVYVGTLYALKAMPGELHTNLVLPLVTRLRPSR
jgi:O-antigen/teichoic acid export membrane protein